MLSKEQKCFYVENGYLAIEGFFDTNRIAATHAAIAELLSNAYCGARIRLAV